MVDVELELEPKVEVITRVEAIYRAAYQISQLCDAGTFCLSKLKKGILDEHVLEEVSFYFIGSHKKRLAVVSIRIDWDEYTASITQPDGDEFRFITGKDLIIQLSDILPLLGKCINDLNKTENVKSVNVTYMFIKSIRGDAAKHDEYRKKFGVSPCEASYYGKVSGSGRSFTVAPERLKEISFNFTGYSDD